MYTRCTYCEAWLRITAAQLRSGLGDVRCGSCMRVFSALVHLDDALPDGAGEPPVLADPAARPTGAAMFRLDTRSPPAVADGDPAAASAPAPARASASIPTGGADGLDESVTGTDAGRSGTGSIPPQVFASGQPWSISLVPHETPAGAAAAPVEGATDPVTDAVGPFLAAAEDHLGVVPGRRVPATGVPPDRSARGGAAPGAATSEARDQRPGQAPASALDALEPVAETLHVASSVRATAARPRDDEQVPDVLREDLARLALRRSPIRRALAWFAATALLLALPLQYAWFQPDAAARRYPPFAHHVERLCAATGCPMAVAEVPLSVRLVGREVRIHPRYEGALEIVGVIVNDTDGLQRFPQIRFTLFNVNGDVIGSRVFAPRQYLDPEYRDAAGMPPGEAIGVRLELIAPEDTAVSFEFEFI